MREIVRGRKVLPPLGCEIQALRIGNLVLLGISGEPFFEIGEQVRASFPRLQVWPLGYTNGYCGYLPTRREIPGGGYEVQDSWKFLGIWRPDESAEQLVVASACEVLSRIK